MTATLPVTVTFRRAVSADFAEVRRIITRDAYLRAGHFAADHPQGGGGGDADVRRPAVQRDRGRTVVDEIVAHARQMPGIEAITITSATFMERAPGLYRSLGFRRAPERDWYVPGEDVLLWVFRLELAG